MTDDGHATQLEWLYRRWFRYAPQEWRVYRRWMRRSFMPDSSLIPPCVAGEGGIRSWDYVRMGFLCRMGVLNEWLTEEEPVAAVTDTASCAQLLFRLVAIFRYYTSCCTGRFTRS